MIFLVNPREGSVLSCLTCHCCVVSWTTEISTIKSFCFLCPVLDDSFSVLSSTCFGYLKYYEIFIFFPAQNVLFLPFHSASPSGVVVRHGLDSLSLSSRCLDNNIGAEQQQQQQQQQHQQQEQHQEEQEQQEEQKNKNRNKNRNKNKNNIKRTGMSPCWHLDLLSTINIHNCQQLI